MSTRVFVLPILVTSFLCAAGCANKETVRAVQGPSTPTTSAAVTPVAVTTSHGNIGVSTDIARACAIEFSDADKAPRFDFDQSALLPGDRAVLNQVAACVTTGPLKGRALTVPGAPGSI